MAAPAHDQIGIDLRAQDVGIAQDVEHGIGHTAGLGQIEAPAALDLGRDIDHVAQHREQVILDPADHLAVDEGLGRRVGELDLDPALALEHADVEALGAFQNHLAVIDLGARVEHGERAPPQQIVHTGLAGIAQTIDLILRQQLETALGGDARVDAARESEYDGCHRRYSSDVEETG